MGSVDYQTMNVPTELVPHVTALIERYDAGLATPPLASQVPGTLVYAPATRPAASVLAILLASLAFAAFVYIGFGVFVPHYEQVFRDFKIELPPFTKSMLHLSRLIAKPAGAASVFVVLGLAPAGLWHLATRGKQRVSYGLTALLLFTAMLIVGCILAYTIFSPMVSLIESVSGPSSRGV